MIRLFKISIPSSVIALIVSEVALLLFCYVAAAYWTLDVSAGIFLIDDRGLLRIGLVVAVLILGLYFHDLYEDLRVRSPTLLVQQTSLLLGIAFVLQAVLSYGRSSWLLPKWLMLFGSLLALICIPSWRIFFADVVSKSVGAQRVLFLGSSPAVREIIAKISERPALGLTPLGYLDQEMPEGEIPSSRRLGNLQDLTSVISAQRPDRIVVGMTERRGQLPVDELLQFRFSGIHIEEAAVAFETIFHRISTRDLRPSQLIFSAELGPRPQSQSLQNLYSWVFGAIGLAIALPFMLIIAVMVRLSSQGPVLFRQTRVGYRGRVFTVFKFRSMYKDAEAQTGAVWAARDDPRITPLGKWLRMLRLDELPQLLNVICGEMSLVGPRPERPEFVKVLQERIPYYAQRHCVRPGITGWAQINHKYGDTLEDSLIKLEFDLYYIKNLSASLDAYIIFHTLKTVLLGRGAQ
ncbi:MAG TPA: sugar transferase [Bryobacteraceae bacterium]|nr:sugar transferase [Bryobacteraceae bacterium]